MKDYDIVKFAHTFCFNDQCQTVSGQQFIFLKFKTNIKSESVRKLVCQSDGFGFVKKWRIRNLSHPYFSALMFSKVWPLETAAS